MTTAKRYTLKELSKMSLSSLAKVGRELDPPLKFNKNPTIRERAKRIIQAYADRDIADKALEQDSESSPPSDQPSPTTRERKPSFERLCQHGESMLPTGSDEVIDGRGGVREGAGRPEGMTNEAALYSRLPQFPHPAIQHFLETAFKTWAARCHCPEVALTREQAVELALPYTQAAYLAGVLDYIPAWAMVSIELVWTTWNMISVKSGLARDAAAKRKSDETEKEESKVAA